MNKKVLNVVAIAGLLLYVFRNEKQKQQLGKRIAHLEWVGTRRATWRTDLEDEGEALEPN